jgi:hypothetical protein
MANARIRRSSDHMPPRIRFILLTITALLKVRYSVSLVHTLSGDELKVNIRHIGMRDRNIAVKIDAVNDAFRQW